MKLPLLHFAHANGIPARCYNSIFKGLKGDFEVLHVDRFGHDPSYPIESGWEAQADQLIDHLDEHAEESVIGAGHSFGASITLLAAIRRPDLFRGLILIEPILVNGWRKYPVRLAERLGYLPKLTPAARTKTRRRQWPDLVAAEAYFRSKAMYNAFDEACLQDFLAHGLVKSDDGYRLYFDVDKEVAIFNSIPTQFDSYRGVLKAMPGAILRGDRSDVAIDDVMKRLARQQKFDYKVVKGGHLFPLEEPDLAIRLIRQYGRLYR